jgi:hypothetical protein
MHDITDEEMNRSASPRIFLWSWVLIWMGGLFVALAVISAGDRDSAGVLLPLGFAALCAWLGFVQRRRAVALEASLAESTPALGSGDVDYEGPDRMNYVLLAFGIAFGMAQVVWILILVVGD